MPTATALTVELAEMDEREKAESIDQVEGLRAVRDRFRIFEAGPRPVYDGGRTRSRPPSPAGRNDVGSTGLGSGDSGLPHRRREE